MTTKENVSSDGLPDLTRALLKIGATHPTLALLRTLTDEPIVAAFTESIERAKEQWSDGIVSPLHEALSALREALFRLPLNEPLRELHAILSDMGHEPVCAYGRAFAAAKALPNNEAAREDLCEAYESSLDYHPLLLLSMRYAEDGTYLKPLILNAVDILIEHVDARPLHELLITAHDLEPRSEIADRYFHLVLDSTDAVIDLLALPPSPEAEHEYEEDTLNAA